MKLRSILTIPALAALFSVAVFAADINGSWKAEMPGRGGQAMSITYNFKAENGKITSCTVTTPRGEMPLSDCKLNGDQISFSQTMKARGGESRTILYKGTVSGNEIKFTREMQGGKGRAQEFTAKKVS